MSESMIHCFNAKYGVGFSTSACEDHVNLCIDFDSPDGVADYCPFCRIRELEAALQPFAAAFHAEGPEYSWRALELAKEEITLHDLRMAARALGTEGKP